MIDKIHVYIRNSSAFFVPRWSWTTDHVPFGCIKIPEQVYISGESRPTYLLKLIVQYTIRSIYYMDAVTLQCKVGGKVDDFF